MTKGIRLDLAGAALLGWIVLLSGCRAQLGRGEPAQTIVVRDATRQTERAYDLGERSPNRIEVIVAEPRDGGAAGNSALMALVGRSVRVQFRRDALGLAAPAPVPPIGQGPGGRAVHLAGIVRSVARQWMVLEHDNSTYWIPQASILLIEQSDTPPTAPAGE